MLLGSDAVRAPDEAVREIFNRSVRWLWRSERPRASRRVLTRMLIRLSRPRRKFLAAKVTTCIQCQLSPDTRGPDVPRYKIFLPAGSVRLRAVIAS